MTTLLLTWIGGVLIGLGLGILFILLNIEIHKGMKTIKIYISETDAEDIATASRKGKERLYTTWSPLIEGTTERVNLKIYLGEEDEKTK